MQRRTKALREKESRTEMENKMSGNTMTGLQQYRGLKREQDDIAQDLLNCSLSTPKKLDESPEIAAAAANLLLLSNSGQSLPTSSIPKPTVCKLRKLSANIAKRRTETEKNMSPNTPTGLQHHGSNIAQDLLNFGDAQDLLNFSLSPPKKVDPLQEIAAAAATLMLISTSGHSLPTSSVPKPTFCKRKRSASYRRRRMY